jgi:hypothetical protein
VVFWLVNLFASRYLEPDQILGEGMPPFMFELAHILTTPAASQLKCPLGRSLCVDEATPRRYEMLCASISPHLLGIPTSRSRTYVAFHLQPFVTAPEVPFEALFRRRLVLCGDVYLAATEETLRRELASATPATAIPTGFATLAEKHVQTMLLPTETLRLECLLQDQERSRMCVACSHDYSIRAPTAFVNLSSVESLDFGHTGKDCPICGAGDLMPGLGVNRNALFDIRSGRLTTIAELWLVQGFPHPDIACLAGQWQEWPFEASVQSASRRTQAQLASATHWAAFGAWFLYSTLV